MFKKKQSWLMDWMDIWISYFIFCDLIACMYESYLRQEIKFLSDFSYFFLSKLSIHKTLKGLASNVFQFSPHNSFENHTKTEII